MNHSNQTPSPPFFKSRIADPLFALTIGASAALLRIRRDQQERFPERAGEITVGSVLVQAGGRLKRWWDGDFQTL
ncbi:hypothetical protein P175DRAFT_0501546 [Aspergillus ochraceoroseus IBT 24754]|uniref:Uncharacterized protein n=1 Tax=Aspergillus ochraceoroseus IBT 24754 TaxID=1392256 RepID=A0A2T5LX98_9EURO|nr:uncharacterized protein P175DRAFT_0501546 [Aspergillus ochraceoroseus IBT 24754]PTU20915.1 hypothetical protein P175DRAFT_0501546 [Aspergillus ochraceoroseus IBT 24754]